MQRLCGGALQSRPRSTMPRGGRRRGERTARRVLGGGHPSRDGEPAWRGSAPRPRGVPRGGGNPTDQALGPAVRRARRRRPGRPVLRQGGAGDRRQQALLLRLQHHNRWARAVSIAADRRRLLRLFACSHGGSCSSCFRVVIVGTIRRTDLTAAMSSPAFAADTTALVPPRRRSCPEPDPGLAFGQSYQRRGTQRKRQAPVHVRHFERGDHLCRVSLRPRCVGRGAVEPSI